MRSPRKNRTTALPKSRRQKRIAAIKKAASQPKPLMKLLPKDYQS